MKRPLITAIFAGALFSAFGQVSLDYYLPGDINYDPNIPTPKSVIRHEVGEWHVTHDRLVNYMNAVAESTDRISIEEHGQTYENRPLLLLTITSPENHQRIDEIREQHLKLTDPEQSSGLDLSAMPAVVYMGYSIHGNEASGVNASLLAAYYLAAAQGKEIEDLLKSTVVLLDPSFNPDGMNRFASWVNSRRGKNLVSDPVNMEQNEVWPGGRTNHYWFDMNRDWLPVQHPESKARIAKFHQWKPNVLTDHHEMGASSTFFFQPGIPARTNPLTPWRNQELTARIGEFHARALDEIKSLYTTQESFDDFYYGKGSTYPDVNGGIGILFEQASSRGHAQEGPHGTLTFPFTIRNQFTATLSTLRAAYSMREDLLEYQRAFYKDAARDASTSSQKAVVFGSDKDPVRSYLLAELISRHDIDIYKLSKNVTTGGKTIPSTGGYIIPMDQPQHRLIRAMFDKVTTFKDSLFYDVSAWTLPLAFGLNYGEVGARQYNPSLQGEKFSEGPPQGSVYGKSEYAYVFEWHGYFAPRALNRLLQEKINAKVSNEVFYGPEGKQFDRGSILVFAQGQENNWNKVEELLKEIAKEDGIDVYGFTTGLDYKGVSLGSRTFSPLKLPRPVMIVEGGVSSSEAGEVWHLLDQRFNMKVTMVPMRTFNRTDLSSYNTLIMVNGNYSQLGETGKKKIDSWVKSGGSIVAYKGALNWLSAAGLGSFTFKKMAENNGDKGERRPYADIAATRGAQQIGGAIFEVEADLSHPLLYGYSNNRLSVFRNSSIFLENSKNAFGNPLVYTSNPLQSGYISEERLEMLKNSSMAGTSAVGQGAVIGFTDNLNFRAFWFGTNKMFMNALFFGHTISNGASR